MESFLGPYTNQTHSSENGYANASNAGVSWYADLKGYIGVQPTKLYGSGTFKLAPKSTTTSGSTTLYGHYVHPKAELGLSVNVSSYGSFSISGGSNYDERGSQKTNILVKKRRGIPSFFTRLFYSHFDK